MHIIVIFNTKLEKNPKISNKICNSSNQCNIFFIMNVIYLNLMYYQKRVQKAIFATHLNRNKSHEIMLFVETLTILILAEFE